MAESVHHRVVTPIGALSSDAETWRGVASKGREEAARLEGLLAATRQQALDADLIASRFEAAAAALRRVTDTIVTAEMTLSEAIAVAARAIYERNPAPYDGDEIYPGNVIPWDKLLQHRGGSEIRDRAWCAAVAELNSKPAT